MRKNIVAALVILAGVALTGCTTAACHEQLLVRQLGSNDVATATTASKMLLTCGSKGIETLATLRGDARLYYGRPPGDRNSAFLTVAPESADKIGRERAVSVEVAALYLINAIYFGDPEFAQSAYLTDNSLPPVERTARNSQERIDAAWSSVDRWLSEYRGRGLRSMRRRRVDPLFFTSIRFW
jgi:hypothetical protein